MNKPKYVSIGRSTSKGVQLKYRHPVESSTLLIDVPETHPKFQMQLAKAFEIFAQRNTENDARHTATKKIIEIPSLTLRQVKTKSFSEVADMALEYYRPVGYNGKSWSEKTYKSQRTLAKHAKEFFGAKNIGALGVSDCAQCIEAMKMRGNSVGKKGREMLLNVFKYAINFGLYPESKSNPAEATFSVQKKSAERLPMTPAQFDAIFAHAPKWIRIAMTIHMETSLRPYDIRNLKWSDIQNNQLIVRPDKTTKIDEKNIDAKYREPRMFDLSQNEILNDAINQARELKAEHDSMRDAYRDCPYIISRVPVKWIKQTIGSYHPLHVTEKVYNVELAEVRDSIHAATEIFSYKGVTYKDDQLPSWSGIRKLSLYFIYKKFGIDAAMKRSDHKEIETLKKFYLIRLEEETYCDVTFSTKPVLKVVK